jgi:hypothetical protein
MNKLMIALIAGALATSAAAQTGTVNPRTIADHGTPAMHAEETKKNVEASKATKGLPDTKAKQQAVKDATRIADHGTPAIHADEAKQNVAASKAVANPIASDAAGQDAVKTAVNGAKR